MSSFSKFESIGRTNFSTAEAISTIEVFNYLLAEIPRYLQIFLKFCHIHSVEISFNFVYASCYILRIYFGGNQRNQLQVWTSFTTVEIIYNKMPKSVHRVVAS